MKISYNWLKWYIPDAPSAKELYDIFTYHLCEVESMDEVAGDTIFDINILPNRAHDLLSHQGVARELASLLNITFADPTEKYKIPESQPTNLEIKIETDKCRRYIGRIIRGVKVGPSPEWVVKHLESIGQRSINNVVDATNIVMYDCGQPCHAFDLDKVSGAIVVRNAVEGEGMTTLDNKDVKFKPVNMVIADANAVLAIAGVKGGKHAEVDNNTKNIILEVANFDGASVRKTAQMLNIFTDSRKRFENELSSELGSYAMRELSATILEMCPEAKFEDIVDTYPQKQEEHKFTFSASRISKILGLEVPTATIEDILKRYIFTYTLSGDKFELAVPLVRLDLTNEEDMAEEIGRILGYDKVLPVIPKINFTPKVSDTYAKILSARNKLLSDGYSEVYTYAFRSKGDVSVEKSASDKKYLRTNLADGLAESLKLNKINSAYLGLKSVKIFEIGTVFKKGSEEIHVAYNDKDKVVEVSLEEFSSKNSPSEEHGYFSAEKFLVLAPSRSQVSSKGNFLGKFSMWSLFPFIARDVAVWVPEGVTSDEVLNIIKENSGDLVVRGPELFDEFKKDSKVSYAFRVVFQSYERTLTDEEVNEVMNKIVDKLKVHGDWQVR